MGAIAETAWKTIQDLLPEYQLLVFRQILIKSLSIGNWWLDIRVEYFTRMMHRLFPVTLYFSCGVEYKSILRNRHTDQMKIFVVADSLRRIHFSFHLFAKSINFSPQAPTIKFSSFQYFWIPMRKNKSI